MALEVASAYRFHSFKWLRRELLTELSFLRANQAWMTWWTSTQWRPSRCLLQSLLIHFSHFLPDKHHHHHYALDIGHWIVQAGIVTMIKTLVKTCNSNVVQAGQPNHMVFWIEFAFNKKFAKKDLDKSVWTVTVCEKCSILRPELHCLLNPLICHFHRLPDGVDNVENWAGLAFLLTARLNWPSEKSSYHWRHQRHPGTVNLTSQLQLKKS